MARSAWAGPAGRKGCSSQQQSLDPSLLHHLKVKNFPASAGGSQSTINRDAELFAWTSLAHDAVEKPRPLGAAGCSRGHCPWGGRAELNKVGGHPLFSFFFLSLSLMFRVCCRIAAFRVWAEGKPGRRAFHEFERNTRRKPWSFYVTFGFENKKWQGWKIYAAPFG